MIEVDTKVFCKTKIGNVNNLNLKMRSYSKTASHLMMERVKEELACNLKPPLKRQSLESGLCMPSDRRQKRKEIKENLSILDLTYLAPEPLLVDRNLLPRESYPSVEDN